jgi:hypothetical protein
VQWNESLVDKMKAGDQDALKQCYRQYLLLFIWKFLIRQKGEILVVPIGDKTMENIDHSHQLQKIR